MISFKKFYEKNVIGISELIYIDGIGEVAAKVDSPRGPFTISKAHNPIQDFYLRQVVGKENKVIGIASKSLADSARGCNM